MKIRPGAKAVVTGAGSGIGRCIALALADEGADLCLIDINEDTLQATARDARRRGVGVVSKTCDLSQPKEVGAAADFVLAAGDRLNILVNCAGIAHYGATDAMTDEQWNRLLSVNLLAPVQLTRLLLPTLLAQGEAHILNVCSIFGLVPAPRLAAYETSKFALVGFSQAMRAEYGRPGFGVTALCPGFVQTPMIQVLANDLRGQGVAVPSWVTTRPEIVAAAAIRAIRRNQGLVVVRRMARAYWWLARISPGFVEWLNRKNVLGLLFRPRG